MEEFQSCLVNRFKLLFENNIVTESESNWIM